VSTPSKTKDEGQTFTIEEKKIATSKKKTNRKNEEEQNPFGGSIRRKRGERIITKSSKFEYNKFTLAKLYEESKNSKTVRVSLPEKPKGINSLEKETIHRIRPMQKKKIILDAKTSSTTSVS